MLKHLAANMDHGKYLKYYIQGDILSLDYTNHIPLSDLLEVSVGWSIMSIQTFQHDQHAAFTFHNLGYSRACTQYSDFLESRLRKCCLIKVMFQVKSSLQNMYCRHHDLVDCYEISICEITRDLFLSTYICSFLDNGQSFHWNELWFCFLCLVPNGVHVMVFDTISA